MWLFLMSVNRCLVRIENNVRFIKHNQNVWSNLSNKTTFKHTVTSWNFSLSKVCLFVPFYKYKFDLLKNVLPVAIGKICIYTFSRNTFFVFLGFNFDNDALDVLVLKTAFFHIMYYATVGIFTACKLAFYVSLFPVSYAFHYDIIIWLGRYDNHVWSNTFETAYL